MNTAGCMCIVWEEMAPEGIMGRRQAGRGGVMLRVMFCWETCPGIHVDVSLTCTTNKNVVPDHIHAFEATVFPNNSGVSLQDNCMYRNGLRIMTKGAENTQVYILNHY